MIQRLANMIDEWCASTNSTLDDLHAISGVPVQTIKRIKQGTTDNPYFDTVVDLVRAMGGSLDELVGISSTLPDPLAELPPDADTEETVESLRLVRDIISKTVDRLRTIIRDKDITHEREIGTLVKAHEKHIRTLRIVLWVSLFFNLAELAFILGVYVYDITHPDIGFFQQDIASLINNTSMLRFSPHIVAAMLVSKG